MREGKHREVKNVLGHLGLAVNRLIRVSFGPFQLGELDESAVEEVRTRILREQLGERVVASWPARIFPRRWWKEPEVEPGSGRPERRASRATKGGRSKSRSAGDDAKNADKRRARDAERFGGPELARREKRRGRRPSPGKKR